MNLNWKHWAAAGGLILAFVLMPDTMTCINNFGSGSTIVLDKSETIQGTNRITDVTLTP